MTQRRLPLPHHPRRPLLALAGAVAAVAAATGPALAAGVPLLTRAQALTVLQGYNVANGKANYALDTALQNQHEEGSAAQIDNATYAMLRLQGKAHEGTSAAPERWTAQVEVPRQASTPANFLATASVNAGGKLYTTVFLFQKDSREQPWRVTYEPGLAVNQHLVLASSAAAKMRTPDTRIMRTLAAYWTAYASHPSLPSALAAGANTSGLVASLEQASTAVVKQGTGQSYVAKLGPWPARTIVVGGGASLTFGTINLDTTIRILKKGVTLVQDTGRTRFPPLVAPGKYTRIVITDQVEVAILTPAKGGPAQVVGIGGGPTRASDTRAG